MSTSFDVQYAADCEDVENALDAAIAEPRAQAQKTVLSAMRYSLLGGGKRIRAVLALECCAMLGGRRTDAMPAACALEMVHAYSLIHDDLPCMDDDDLRRGRPACHIAYGEDMAVLAGDGLQTCAFEMLSAPQTVSLLGAERALRLVGTISRAIGEYGMLGGQCVDVESAGSVLTPPAHRDMVRMKTGALLRAAAVCGGICALADEAAIDTLSRFGEIVGEAFQITDDILDVAGDTEKLGKPVGSDEQEHKNTFVTMLGLDAARERADALYREADALIAPYGEKADFLRQMLSRLAARDR